MSDVKRYTDICYNQGFDDAYSDMVENDCGGYVRYDDYAALEARLAEVENTLALADDQRREWEAHCKTAETALATARDCLLAAMEVLTQDAHRFSRELSEMQREWYQKIPHVPFKPSWDVRAAPPFGGALIRYRVSYKGCEVSIYLDVNDSLGSVGQPYWEIYPGSDGDVERFLLDETDDLAKGIAASIRRSLRMKKATP
jgi:hypothetical protein